MTTLFSRDEETGTTATIRVNRKIGEAYDVLTEAIEEHVTKPKKRLTNVCLLFSGGNDSTVLAHLFRRDVDYLVHINTGIGIEATREFVRSTAAGLRVPLIEEHGDSYRDLVIERGFPGPAQHFKMYQRLKERGLMKVRRRFVTKPRNERVLFVAGRRRSESQRRANVPRHERTGSIVWASPLADWTSADMADYRKVYDVPRNPVSDELHMSGECLCGAFAKKGELDEIAFWRPETAVHIRQLEADVRAAGNAPDEKCRWGWGAYRDTNPKPRNTGPLCSECVLRFDGLSVANIDLEVTP